MIQEKSRGTLPGIATLLALIIILGLLIYSLSFFIRSRETVGTLLTVLCLVADAICFAGLFVVHPNQGVVVQLFGKYTGTVRAPGLHWVNPFTSRKAISLRVRNFETAHLKVNDHDGNPIEIAAVVVWNVVDTAEAAFEVDHYEDYVHVQSEAALRNLATAYPYDSHDEAVTSLRGQTAIVAAHLKKEIQERLAKAGVEVMEARISHLAYAPEIAAVMLQRQQASAIIAARQKIVEGAVGMVQSALHSLSEQKIIELDEDKKATMVNNLMVALVSDREVSPIINTGTLYQ